MAQLILFGAGKVADVLYRHVAAAGEHAVVAFTCDAEFVPESGTFYGRPVVPFPQVAERYPPGEYAMMIALGYHELNDLRRRRYEEAKAKGYRLVSYVSRRAAVGDWLEMGDNCVILDDAIVEPGVRLGNNVVVWSGVLIGHHSVVEDHAWIAGRAVFGGSTRLGSGSFVGLGAVVGHEVEIGERSFLGAGVLVTKCADARSVFVGKNTELFRLDSERFLKISKLR